MSSLSITSHFDAGAIEVVSCERAEQLLLVQQRHRDAGSGHHWLALRRGR